MTTRQSGNDAALPRIFTVRKQRAVVDAELAKLHGVPVKRLNDDDTPKIGFHRGNR